MSVTSDLSYPIGRFQRPESITPEDQEGWISSIEALPAKLRASVTGLSEAQLETPYRPGGWTVRQVVHHLFDSHVNSYMRFKLALSEENPTIKPYDEAAWAELADAKDAPVELSLTLLEALHSRWVMLLRTLTPEDLKRGFVHPGLGRTLTLEINLSLYAWHGEHHLAHIERLKEREGWGL